VRSAGTPSSCVRPGPSASCVRPGPLAPCVQRGPRPHASGRGHRPRASGRDRRPRASSADPGLMRPAGTIGLARPAGTAGLSPHSAQSSARVWRKGTYSGPLATLERRRESSVEISRRNSNIGWSAAPAEAVGGRGWSAAGGGRRPWVVAAAHGSPRAILHADRWGRGSTAAKRCVNGIGSSAVRDRARPGPRPRSGAAPSRGHIGAWCDGCESDRRAGPGASGAPRDNDRRP
jgi:hypothetical protein